MEFICTRRTADGGLEDLPISASSREEAFQSLRRQGVVPVSVRLADAPRRISRSRFPRMVVGSVLGVSAAAGLVLLLVLCARSRVDPADRSPQEKTPAPARPESKQKAVPDVPPPAMSLQVPDKDAETAPSKPKTAKEVLADHLAHPPSVTNYMVGITVTTNRPKRIHRNATEQMLSSLFRTELGSAPPPMPKIPMREKVDIEGILSSPLSAPDGDSEASSSVKDVVGQAKLAMKEFLDRGGTPEAFISYYRDELQRCHETWKMCQQAAIRSCREEDPEVAREMVGRINETLSEKGIKPVSLPPRFRERLEIK